jgi:hypothetical protein
LELGFAFFGGAALLAAGALGLAVAQVNCETLPAGPARTDCYIGLGRINRQKSEISAGVARQEAKTAIYYKVTGKRADNKRRRTVPAW